MKKRIIAFLLAATLAVVPALPAMAMPWLDFIKSNDGWSYIQGSNSRAWVYVKDGEFVDSGLQEIDGYFYYFEPCAYTDEQGNSTSVPGIPMNRRGIRDRYYQMLDNSVAVERWIAERYDKWAYFGKDGKQVRGPQTIDGKSYDFGDDGFITQAPFPEMEILSIKLDSDYKQIAYVGDTVEVPFTIKVRTLKTPTPSNAAEWVEGEADYQIFKKAYDINHTYRQHTSGGMEAAVATKFEIDWDKQVLRIPIKESGWVAIGPGEDGATFTIDNGQSRGQAENGICILCLDKSAEDPEKAAEDMLNALLSVYDKNNFYPDYLVKWFKSASENGVLKKTMENLINANDKEKISDFGAILSDIEEKYKTESSITASSQIDQSALSLLGSNSVNVAGLGLSADDGDTIEFRVSESKENGPEEFQNRYKTVVPLDLSVFINDSPLPGGKLKIPVIITIPLPEGMDSANVKVFHIHDGEEKPELVRSIEAGNNVSFVADEFSTYLLAEEKKQNKPQGDGSVSAGGTASGSHASSSGSDHSSSDSSGSAETAPQGTWQQDQTGWWYRNPDGTYPVNAWVRLPYYQRYDWYHFDERGYMQTGWFLDTDGRWYYLNPVSNGTLGAMVTGWKQIEDDWYYFNEVSDGYKGAMYANTVTPDGYETDSQGRWIQ